MMGIGFSELVVILLVVLVFIRPEDLPAFFRKLGRIYAELKKGYDELTAVKDEFIREVEAAAKVEDGQRQEPAPGEAASPPPGEAGERGGPEPAPAPVAEASSETGESDGAQAAHTPAAPAAKTRKPRKSPKTGEGLARPGQPL
ncbi:MAG TPA: hypothetical protein VFL04_00625 [Rectinemataceae bacterium]|nr:hypothetical protein [Rectinemataceae bacterium]